MKRNAFAHAEPELRGNGYSPIPILPNTKRPALAGWQKHCRSLMAGTVSGRYAVSPLAYGVGVTLGYDGLVAIDIDTEDPTVMEAVRIVLPASLVGKRGAHGRTDFYFDPSGAIKPRKFRARGGDMLLEVLATGNQTVVPPSIHPNTRQPYFWLGAATLLNTGVDGLPIIVPDICERFARALNSWRHQPLCSAPRKSTRPLSREQSDAERLSHSRYARAILDRDAASLASMRPNTGRNVAVFRLACRLGRWVHHGLISVDEVVGAIMEACERNGLIREDGRRSVLATIASGLRKSVGDTLPDLERRRHG